MTKQLDLDCDIELNDSLIEWHGMPEFVQEKKEPFKTLVIRFENEADYKEFQKIINQKLTYKTKSIWHPFKSHWGLTRKVYKNAK